MSKISSNDIVAILAGIVSEHTGDDDWREFFRDVEKLARTGLANRDDVVWRDDGSGRDLVQHDSLLHFCSNVWSQRGDDGIIRRIFQTLRVYGGFFVEFGAWDGIHFANSRALAQRGWTGCFIEGDAEKARRLRSNYSDSPGISCVHAVITPSPSAVGRTIDEIASKHFPGRAVDFLSIDIDGLDYRIFEEMKIHPSVVCIEGGFPWHPRFDRRLTDDIAGRNLCQPLAVLIGIGAAKGYTPVCFNQNTYFVADKFAHHFSKIINDPVSLWRDAWFNETAAFREFIRQVRARPVIRDQEGREFEHLEFDTGI